MRATTLLSGLVATTLSLSAHALPTISTKGSYFFTSQGNRWFIKGVAYQLYSTGGDNVDPFVDIGQCTRDANLMASIGVNAVRVYHVRPAVDHSACMSVFINLGIYTFIDLDDYPSQLDENNFGWSNQQKAYMEAVMDEFAQFENTAGFFIGNENINDGSKSGLAPYLRSAVRDMRAYRTSKGYRAIPIGYSHADIQSVGQNLENYFACTSATQDASSMLEFYSLNSYRWCGSNTFQGSGYSTILNQTADYPIPIFMSETGCNQPEPRLFQDQVALLGPEMNNVWSGAIIYEWLQEDNHYGLVTYEGGSADALVYTPPAGQWPRTGTPTPVQPDFNNLKTVWAGINPTGVNINAYTPSLSPLACPTYQVGSWQVDPNQPLPSITGSVTQSVARAFNGGAGGAAAVPAPATTTVVTASVAPAATTSAAVVSSIASSVRASSASVASSVSSAAAVASSAAASSASVVASSAAVAASSARPSTTVVAVVTSVVSSVAAAAATSAVATSVRPTNAGARPSGVAAGLVLALAGVVGVAI